MQCIALKECKVKSDVWLLIILAKLECSDSVEISNIANQIKAQFTVEVRKFEDNLK
jgi:hypothetical protein